MGTLIIYGILLANLQMDCTVKVASGLRRCENQEVVCYVMDRFYKGAMQCKWKDKVESEAK